MFTILVSLSGETARVSHYLLLITNMYMELCNVTYKQASTFTLHYVNTNSQKEIHIRDPAYIFFFAYSLVEILMTYFKSNYLQMILLLMFFMFQSKDLEVK